MNKFKYLVLGLVIASVISAITVHADTVLFPHGGGTGTSTPPTYGQVLVGTSGGVYAPQATSTLGIGGSGTNYFTNSGSNTYLNTGSNLEAPYFTATSTTATSTFVGPVQFATTTTSNFNGIIIVDGTHFATTTSGIQSAINACSSLYLLDNKSCGEVYLPAGNYSITPNTINLASNINLVGSGEGTKITAPNTPGSWEYFNAQNVSNITVKDMFLSAANTSPLNTTPQNNTFGFYVYNDSNINFQNVRFEQFYEDIEGSKVGGSTFNHIYDYSGGNNIGTEDITNIDSLASSTFSNITCNAEDTCIRLEGAQNVNVTGSILTDASIEIGNADSSGPAHNISISGNTFIGNINDAITLINFSQATSDVMTIGKYQAGVSNISITGNTFDLGTSTSYNSNALLGENDNSTLTTAIANVTFTGNTISSNNQGGVHSKEAGVEAMDNSGTAYNWNIADNYMGSTTGDAIKLISPVNSKVHDNIAWNYGTNANGYADNACVYIGGTATATSSNTEVYNNNCTGPVGPYTSTGLYIDNPAYITSLTYFPNQFYNVTAPITFYSTAPTSTPTVYYGTFGLGTTTPAGTFGLVGNLYASTTATSTFQGNGINLTAGCFAIAGTCLSSGGGSGATSVSNADGTLTISPTTGSVIASLALGHANTWTGAQIFSGNVIKGGTQYSTYANTLDLSSDSGTPTIAFGFPGSASKFTVQQNNINGTGDVLMQALPISTGYGIVESYGGQGLSIETGGNSNPILFKVNRTEVARINSSGLLLADNSAETIIGNWGMNLGGSGNHPVQVVGSSLFVGYSAGFPGGTTYPTNNLLVAGNIGIGTTSPYKTLSVSGSLALTGGLFDSTASEGTNGMVLSSTGSATQWVATSSLGFLSSTAIGSGSQGYIPFYNSSGTNLTATSSIFIAQNGNVGIGTASPADGLDIENANGTNVRLSVITGQGYKGYSIGGVNIFSMTRGDTVHATDLSISSNGGIGFTPNVSSPSTSYKMYMDLNGNVGIGTTSPYAKLSVAGTIVGQNFVATSTTATSTFAGGLQAGGSSGLYVTQSGNVGIGTTSPTLGALTVQPRFTGQSALTLEGLPSQSSDIFDIDNSSGATYLSVGSSGTLNAYQQIQFTGPTFGQFQDTTAGAGMDFKTVAGTGDITFTPNANTLLSLLHNGEIKVGGGTPTIGTCGTSPSISGTDNAGKVTVGSGVVTSCAVAYSTSKAGTPHVFVEVDGATAIASSLSASSASGFTVNFGASLGSGTFDYWVISN